MELLHWVSFSTSRSWNLALTFVSSFFSLGRRLLRFSNRTLPQSPPNQAPRSVYWISTSPLFRTLVRQDHAADEGDAGRTRRFDAQNPFLDAHQPRHLRLLRTVFKALSYPSGPLPTSRRTVYLRPRHRCSSRGYDPSTLGRFGIRHSPRSQHALSSTNSQRRLLLQLGVLPRPCRYLPSWAEPKQQPQPGHGLPPQRSSPS
ncbi:hypothetical protein BDY24DRAFT_27593 [Mrakia frigida]|uniref:uncharacterized protein n=1 Tax=Mrakia frigida TaxID=29902 RepID=UPI003FCC1A0C